MARVTGPLMSIDASGTYGKSLVFAKWKGRNYVREHVKPSNPKTAKQIGVRSMLAFLAMSWNGLASLAKGTWTELAAQSSISPFNAFISANLKRWQNFAAPTQANPAAEASTGLTITTQTLTGGAGSVTIQLTPSAGTNISGYMIFRDIAEITAPSWDNCVAVIPADGANQVTFVDSPLAAGVYHYRAVAFNVDGKLGTVHADASSTAT